jgi:23S rRNA (pseudouridine1915-N3)-methyltransferase
MKLLIVVVGRLKDRYLEEGINDYLKRLKRYGTCELIRVKEESKRNRSAEAAAVEKEAQRILAQIKPGDFLVTMTEEGDLVDSQTLAHELDDIASRTPGRIVFVIGSGAGLAPSVKAEANRMLSLSPMTFPHQVALLLLTEQLYRANSILNNEPYHR